MLITDFLLPSHIYFRYIDKSGIQVDQTVKFVLYHSGSFKLFRKSPSIQPSTNMEWVDSKNTRIYFTNTLQKSYPQKLYCILFRIRQIFQQLLSDLTTLINSLSFHQLTCCPLPFFALSVSKQLIVIFLFLNILLYIWILYQKNCSKNITLSRTMFYCIQIMFLLFLFGASRKTACRGYTCPSKFPLINIVNDLWKIICIILDCLWHFENKYSVCLSAYCDVCLCHWRWYYIRIKIDIPLHWQLEIY